LGYDRAANGARPAGSPRADPPLRARSV